MAAYSAQSIDAFATFERGKKGRYSFRVAPTDVPEAWSNCKGGGS